MLFGLTNTARVLKCSCNVSFRMIVVSMMALPSWTVQIFDVDVICFKCYLLLFQNDNCLLEAFFSYGCSCKQLYTVKSVYMYAADCWKIVIVDFGQSWAGYWFQILLLSLSAYKTATNSCSCTVNIKAAECKSRTLFLMMFYFQGHFKVSCQKLFYWPD